MAAGLYLGNPGLYSRLLPMSFIMLWVAVYFLPKQPPSRLVLGFSLFIVGSTIMGVFLSPFFDRPLAPSLWLAVLTLVLVPLLWLQDIKPVLYWLIPVWYLQAVMMAWQWFTGPFGERAVGFSGNANAGSSFLLLGAIFLATHPRLKWLAVPLLVAIPFSGSRWTLLVGIAIFTLMFVSRHVAWKYIAVGIMTAFALLMSAQHSELQVALRVGESPKQTFTNGETHAIYRLTPPRATLTTVKTVIPQGFIDSNLHNVPMRMTVETGILSALAWIAVGIVGLACAPRGYKWWMMLAVYLLSAMYYFTWVGPLGAFWWLLASQLKSRDGKLNNKHG